MMASHTQKGRQEKSTVAQSGAAMAWYSDGNWIPLFLGRRLSDPALRVLGALVRGIRYRLRDWEVDGDTAQRVTIQSLADRAEVGRKSVTRAIPKLVDAGLIDGHQAADRIWSIRLLPPSKVAPESHEGSGLAVLSVASASPDGRVSQSRRSGLAVLRRILYSARERDLKEINRNQKRLVSSKTPSTDSLAERNTPRITNIVSTDLEDIGRLLELHRQAVKRGWATPGYLGPTGELTFVSAAVHAQRIVRQHGKGDPVRLFAWFARGLDQPIGSIGTASPDHEQFEIAAWEDEPFAKYEGGEGRTNRRSDFLTADDEQIAHRRMKQHRYGEVPRGASPLSTDARFVQHFLRVARNRGWQGNTERMYAMLKDRLGDDWTQQRWDDAYAELRDGGGPVHIGRILSACLAESGIVEPTVKLFQPADLEQGVA